MVFFLPLGMAALHIAMAFPMVKRLLARVLQIRVVVDNVCTHLIYGSEIGFGGYIGYRLTIQKVIAGSQCGCSQTDK